MVSKQQNTHNLTSEDTSYHPVTMHSSNEPLSSPPLPSSPPHDANRQSLVFTKAAFAFRDILDTKRSKEKVEVVEHVVQVEEPETPGLQQSLQDQKRMRRIRIMRSVQHALTASLAIIISYFQGITYTTYKSTENVQGAWPVDPQLVPTLLLFAVAVSALVFDVSALLAYLFPNTRIGQRAFKIAVSTHSFVGATKSFAYAVSAIVCRTSFNSGNASGQNKDLWSWTCSPKADAEASVNKASFLCTGSVSSLPI
jgi:hypothetical protein